MEMAHAMEALDSSTSTKVPNTTSHSIFYNIQF